MDKNFVPEFNARLGTRGEQYLLLQFMQRTYKELHPGHDYQHLRAVIDQYWSTDTPYWLVTPENEAHRFVACLWLGTAVDQVTGDAYTHIFILFVDPAHRQQGLGTALLQRAEAWAAQQGDQQIGLQVFTNAHPALSLYEKLGYQPKAVLLVKPIQTQ